MNMSLLRGILGRFLMVYGATVLFPVLVAIYFQEGTSLVFIEVSVLTVLVGLFLQHRANMDQRMSLREGYLIVTLSWFLASLLGALPFYLTHVVPTYVDAVFECVSGLTTTGASVIPVMETLPQSILLWRSTTHLLGGMGIIVLFLVLLPNLGIGGAHLFQAESTGPTSDKALPSTKTVAKRLWLIYLLLTFVSIVLLKLAGMPFLDAVNHGFATIATGGFSTRTASIAAYNSLTIEIIVIVFMTIAGVNFGLFISAQQRGLSAIWKDTEFRVYLAIILGASFAIAFSLVLQNGMEVGGSLRYAFFQVSTIMTTTGYASMDFDQWPSVTKLILFMLMIIGGSAGSTTGGLKVIRLIFLVKMIVATLRQITHPHLVTQVTYQGRVMPPAVMASIGIFTFMYLGILAVASFILAATGLEPFDAFSAVAATLSNIGPGFGVVGPTQNFSIVTPFGKVVLILCMLLGRLELMTMLVLFQPEFWRSRKGW